MKENGQVEEQDMRSMKNGRMEDRRARTKRSLRTQDMVLSAMFAVLIAICSWISIPMTIPFTLQTFGVFMAVEVLGGKRGTLAVLIYLILGVTGIPVFANFTGGIGILLGMTGGYIIGFLFSALIMWLIESKLGTSPQMRLIAMVAGLIVCYVFGTIWFMAVYTKTSGAVALTTVLGWCVIPFIIPDLIKIALAYFLAPRIRKAASLEMER